jgi:hypothetical protein
MKIAVLSDTRLPTSANFPGHGLGKINLAVAEGLTARGHDVTLFAGWGSETTCRLVTGYQEMDFYQDGALTSFDAILDGGHEHQAAQHDTGLPIVNVSHDREHPPGRCAVYVSEAHRAWWRDPRGRVVRNGVDITRWPVRTNGGGDYLAWLGHFHSPKGPYTARQVTMLTGVPVQYAGPVPPVPHGLTYVGPKSGADLVAFLHGARALLAPFSIESAGLVALEAAACGVPVIGLNLAGLPEYIEHGVTGFVCDGVDELADAVERTNTLESDTVRQWVADHRTVEQMVDGYERALMDVANGEQW